MNHYDLIIRDYLEEQKSVSFEKIGSLVITDKNTSEDQQFIPGSLQFKYNKKAATSPGLVDYIAQRLAKNKGLIQSDLESYIELMRQFINIGKPYEMEGVGVFKLAKSNEYEFTAYDMSEKKEEQKSGKRQHPANTSPLTVKHRNNRSALMLLAVLIILTVLVVIGWGTYKLLMPGDSPKSDTAVLSNNSKPADTIVSTNNLLPADSRAITKGDTADYKFIYETTSLSSRAYLRTAQLKKFGNQAAIDSIGADSAKVYELYIKMRLYNADTTKAKDSIQKHLQRSVKIVAIK